MLSRVDGMDEAAAQLAIESCRNNEVVASCMNQFLVDRNQAVVGGCVVQIDGHRNEQGRDRDGPERHHGFSLLVPCDA